MKKSELKKAAAALGSRGGSVRSEAKAKAVRKNGKKGGRPTIDVSELLAQIERDQPNPTTHYYKRVFSREWRKARRLNLLNVWQDDTGAEFVTVGPQQY